MIRNFFFGVAALFCVGCGNDGSVSYQSPKSERMRIPPGAIVYSYAEVSESVVSVSWYEFQYKGQCFLRSQATESSVMANIQCPDSLKNGE